MQTTAVLDGDYYVLNGQKRWISQGPEAGGGKASLPLL
jgi:alkylation response protein AidB-like acyl-CoA dehydrogenase